MAKQADPETPFVDLRGEIQVGGYQDVLLLELASYAQIPSEYHPIGVRLDASLFSAGCAVNSVDDGPDVMIYLVDKDRQGELPTDVPLFEFPAKIPWKTIFQVVKSVSIVLKDRTAQQSTLQIVRYQ